MDHTFWTQAVLAQRGKFPIPVVPFVRVTRGFPKTSVFGKASLKFKEKTAFWLVFPEPLPKLTEFW
jgi:hypothetical protein